MGLFICSSIFFIIGLQGNSCDDYFILNDATRNSEYGYSGGYCDQVDYWQGASPDWKGPAWYRMKEPAGIAIPEEPVEAGWQCNAQISGWLNGHHPNTTGEIVNRTVCFSAGNGNTCQMESQIEIKHCDSYYLYYLGEVPDCNIRYCSTSTLMKGMYVQIYHPSRK